MKQLILSKSYSHSLNSIRRVYIINIRIITYILLVAMLFIGIMREGVAGNIIGTVVNINYESPIENADVYFFDALNAELLGVSTTGPTGEYNSGNIPDGEYRVKFEFSNVSTGIYRSGFYGVDLLNYGSEYFCAASIVQVISGSPTVVNEAKRETGPWLNVETEYGAWGIVADAYTLVPLQGIQVSFIDGYNGYLYGISTTDAYGFYSNRTVTSGKAGSNFVKLRFTDSSGTYFPEYYGANDTDSFCGGTAVSSPPTIEGFVSYMDRIPTDEEVTQGVINKLDSFNLPNNVDSMLSTPLTQTIKLLTDDNPANDTAACKQLVSFISRVDIQEKNGQLTEAEANSLRQSTEAAIIQLGCQV